MSRCTSPAMRRYTFRVFLSMLGYLVTLSAAVWLLRDGDLTGPLAWVVAVLPGLCVIGVFWAFARLLVEETDEYLRHLMVRQSLVATGFTLSIATVWGFLSTFDQVPRMDTFYIAVLWFLGLGVGQCWTRWSDRRAAADA